MQFRQNLQYERPVCLKSTKTGQYFSFDSTTKRATANSLHPFCKGLRKQHILNQFFVLNSLSKEIKTVTFGVKYQMSAGNGKILKSNQAGEIILFDPNTRECEQNMQVKQIIAQTTTTFVIIPVTGEKRPVCYQQEVMLKFSNGGYLTCKYSDEVDLSQRQPSVQTIWKIQRSQQCPIPQWAFTRPSSNLGTSKMLVRQQDKKALSSYATQVQEAFILEDLINIFMGFQGIYIKKRRTAKSIHFQFQNLGEEYNQALIQLSQRMLPIAQQFNFVKSFTSITKLQPGNVVKSFAASVDSLLKQFLNMVIGLDEQFKRSSLTLQKLLFYIQPAITTMQILSSLIAEVQGLGGGALLNIITRKQNLSKQKGISEVLQYLMKSSAKPYICILQKWLYQGVIQDPYLEFMIKADNQISKNTYQLNRHYCTHKFQLQPANVPEFLFKLQSIVLSTGKSLNIIKQSGVKFSNPEQGSLYLNYQKLLSTDNFRKNLQMAYNWANQNLMHLILKEKQLQKWLKSIKGFFFLQYGDLFVQFIQTASEQLLKNFNQVSKQKLQIVLQNLIRGSSANNDPNKQNIKCKLSADPKYQFKHVSGGKFPSNLHMLGKAIYHFTLQLKTEWPLNLIFSYQNMLCYQVLFRHFLNCKIIEQDLCSLFSITKNFKSKENSSLMTLIFLTVQRMLHYIKNLLYNLCYEIIQHNWQILQENINKANNLDQILTAHKSFLNSCINESLLRDQFFIDLVYDLNQTCLTFTSRIKQSTKTKGSIQLLNQDVQTIVFNSLMAMKKYIVVTNKCFSKKVSNLIERLRSQAKKRAQIYLINLLSRFETEDLY